MIVKYREEEWGGEKVANSDLFAVSSSHFCFASPPPASPTPRTLGIPTEDYV